MNYEAPDPTIQELCLIAASLNGGTPKDRVDFALNVWDEAATQLAHRGKLKAVIAEEVREAEAMIEGISVSADGMVRLEAILAHVMPGRDEPDRFAVFREFMREPAHGEVATSEQIATTTQQMREKGVPHHRPPRPPAW